MRIQKQFAVLIGIAVSCVGCGQQGSELSSTAAVESTPAVFNTGGAPTVEFSVPDMMCPEGCGEKTKEILAGQPGAKDVMIDFPAKTAIVAVEGDAFDADEALAALVDHGFDHSTLKDEAAAKPQTAGGP